MRLLFLSLAAGCCSLACIAADPVQEGHYVDEATNRYLTLQKGDLGSTRVTVRFANDPGSTASWTGIGQRKDKVLLLAREAGEGEERGTFFLATVSESKVEITTKPGQKKPEDAGINGTYRRASDAKLQQLAKKEAQLANTRLLTALKNGMKKWSAEDRPALLLWKEQWPAMRDRWLDIASAPKKDAPGKPSTPAPAPPAATGEKPADYWLKLAQAAMMGYAFVETLPDPKTKSGWEGEYDDFAGGHASITVMRDGRFHVTLSFSRAGDAQTGTLELLAKPDAEGKDKAGAMTAALTFADPEVTDASQHARVKLTRNGRYLVVETEKTARYAARGWFDGIYRGQPPQQQ